MGGGQYLTSQQVGQVGRAYTLFIQLADGKRYRSLGCGPCQSPIASTAKNVDEIIAELKSGALRNIAERGGRAQDQEGRGGLEELRKDGYM